MRRAAPVQTWRWQLQSARAASFTQAALHGLDLQFIQTPQYKKQFTTELIIHIINYIFKKIRPVLRIKADKPSEISVVSVYEATRSDININGIYYY